jgi:hypothetical protein
MAVIKELVSGERLDQDLKMGNGEGDLTCLFGYGKQTITSGDSVVLVTGKPASGQTRLKANMVVVTMTAGGKSITLPPVADWAGVPLIIINAGGTNDVEIRDSADALILTLTKTTGTGGVTKPEAVFISTGTTVNIID